MVIEKKKSIREQVYEVMKKLIINGEIEFGERIVEVEYAEKFQVSRTPVREAIRMLELEGLLEVNSKGGVTVKEITEEDIREIYKIRIALESLIIEEIVSAPNQRIEELEKLFKETEELMKIEVNSKEVIKKFAEFNNIFYSVSNLTRVVELIKNLNLYLNRFRKISISDDNRRIGAFEEHKALVKALKDRQLEKALKINREHLADSMEFILARLKSNSHLKS